LFFTISRIIIILYDIISVRWRDIGDENGKVRYRFLYSLRKQDEERNRIYTSV